jgi:hypothetical protein
MDNHQFNIQFNYRLNIIILREHKYSHNLHHTLHHHLCLHTSRFSQTMGTCLQVSDSIYYHSLVMACKISSAITHSMVINHNLVFLIHQMAQITVSEDQVDPTLGHFDVTNNDFLSLNDRL